MLAAHVHRGRPGGGRGHIAAFAAAVAALAVELSLFAVLALSAQPVVPEPPEGPVTVSDRPASAQVPLYLQTDERWGGLPYAGADLATSGCGLTCAAMAWSYLSGEEWTPVQVLNAVGNDYVQEGQNYMPGFCEWMAAQDPTLDYTVLYEDRDRALTELADGRMVFGAMEGKLHDGGRSYGGHIVLLVGTDGETVTVHDPCEAMAVKLDSTQFQAVPWDYFISIGRN